MTPAERTQPENIHIFHFTNIRNLHTIIERGLIADSFLNINDYINSGDIDIKKRRKEKKVIFGGVVSDYVPFYFAPRSPMLYKQWINGLVNNEEIIYLVSTVSWIVKKQYTWCCSDMNAAKNFARFYNTIDELINNIKWDIIESRIWKNDDDHPDRMEKRMAEFLIYNNVKFDDFLYICTYNNEAMKEVESIINGRFNGRKFVAPQMYF